MIHRVVAEVWRAALPGAARWSSAMGWHMGSWDCSGGVV